MRLASTFVLLFSVFTMYSQSRFDVASEHLLNKNFDSVYLELKAIKSKKEAHLMAALLFNFASYKDYTALIENSVDISRKNTQNLIYFLDSRIKTPSNRKTVNLDYVKLRSRIIDILANSSELSIALEEHEKLQDYMNSISEQNGDFDLAVLYLNHFDVLIGVIENDLEKLDQGFVNAKRALELKDTNLFLTYTTLTSHKHVISDNLIDYNKSLFNAYHIGQNMESKSLEYYAIVGLLMDGLIYSDFDDRDFIESKIWEVYNHKGYNKQSYLLIVKYLIYMPYPEQEQNNRFLQRFGHGDLFDLVAYVKNSVAPYLHNNEYITIHIHTARLLYENKEFMLALELMHDAVLGTREIFSKDLSEILADHKTRSIAREKELIVQQEKEKNDIYLKLGISIFILFLMTGILAIALARRKNILKAKNEENEALIKEKDLLMQEIHHRVKNNFELVSALLELQSTEIENEAAKKKLYEGQARIQSLSLLHNKLYQTNESTFIDMQQYISELAALMLKSADLTEKVEVLVHAHEVNLDIDTITPLGLIINELITNSFKYAFKGQGKWKLEITLKKAHNDYLLTYTEQGVDNNWDFDSTSKKGLGMVLIKSLIKQLHGKLEFQFMNGAQFKINFKDKLRRKNID